MILFFSLIFRFCVFSLLLATFSPLLVLAETGDNTRQEPYILVSVAPHRLFVERIAGDTVKVGLLVPAGASAHTFEPSPKQMIEASRAEIWFRIGEGFESRALAALKSHHPKIDAIDLREGLDLIYPTDHDHHHGCCHCSAGMDMHFWLSPRLAKQQAVTIAKALIQHYPQYQQRYHEALNAFLKELDSLDREIIGTLAPLQNRTIFVSHPAYAYLCRDYQLVQLSIEFEGKDPTPQQLTKILQTARQKKIKKVFIQKQYNNKGAQLVAEELGAQLVMLDPYGEDYINTLREIVLHFSKN